MAAGIRVPALLRQGPLTTRDLPALLRDRACWPSAMAVMTITPDRDLLRIFADLDMGTALEVLVPSRALASMHPDCIKYLLLLPAGRLTVELVIWAASHIAPPQQLAALVAASLDPGVSTWVIANPDGSANDCPGLNPVPRDSQTALLVICALIHPIIAGFTTTAALPLGPALGGLWGTAPSADHGAPAFTSEEDAGGSSAEDEGEGESDTEEDDGGEADGLLNGGEATFIIRAFMAIGAGPPPMPFLIRPGTTERVPVGMLSPAQYEAITSIINGEAAPPAEVVGVGCDKCKGLVCSVCLENLTACPLCRNPRLP